MGFLDLFKAPDYDSIEPKAVQSNRLVATGTKEIQAALKKVKVGDLVTFKKSKRDGNTCYIVSAWNTGSRIGEISYGTSGWLAENYPDAQLLGRVTAKVHGDAYTPSTVDIEYKLY